MRIATGCEGVNPVMIIGTHNGKFHADEVFAIAILKQLHPTAKVVRSRDTEQLNRCDIIVDVMRSKYDHHTKEKIYRPNGIPYASAGLVWRDFSADVLRTFGSTVNLETLARTIDDKLIQGIDAVDNGVDLVRDPHIRGIPEIIGTFNPPWNSDADENEAFVVAVQFASQILVRQIKAEVARMDAAQVVEAAFARRDKPGILVLDTFCPWTETLMDLDKEAKVLYVIFRDKADQYRLQVVPKSLGSFEARKPLPETWAGKEGAELAQLIDIPDAVFCHPARFIAGAKSQQSILKMAQMALDA